MKKITLLFLAVYMSGFGISDAQIAGNPAGVNGTSVWSVSANAGYMTQQLDFETVSKRMFIKSEWGITSWLDYYLMGGIFDLQLDFTDNQLTNFKSKMKFCYGTGFDIAFKIPGRTPLAFWSGAQIFAGPAQGEYFRDIPFAGTIIRSEKYKLKYNWSEVKGFMGLIYYGSSFKIYAAGAGWFLQTISERKGYTKDGLDWSLSNKVEGEDRSDIWTGGFVGIEIEFHHNIAFTFECLAFNEKNFHIMVGLSQTGNPGW